MTSTARTDDREPAVFRGPWALRLRLTVHRLVRPGTSILYGEHARRSLFPLFLPCPQSEGQRRLARGGRLHRGAIEAGSASGAGLGGSWDLFIKAADYLQGASCERQPDEVRPQKRLFVS